jgi:hypothetical protein
VKPLLPALLLVVVCTAFLTLAQEADRPQAEQVAVLKDKRINESSGLAPSLLVPDVFWTLNDSASDPCLFAIDQTGRTRAKVRLPDAVNFDWEDIASARGADGRARLFVADTGDNLHVRPAITVYEIPEPPLPEQADKEILSDKPRRWHARYPDGRHDAEVLLVHPLTRRLYLVTKSPQGHSSVYAFPEQPGDESPMVLEKLTDLEFPPRAHLGKRPHDACMTTAGDFSPDATRLAIGTYSFIHEWTLKPADPLQELSKKSARLIELPVLPQMEALCYGADGRTLWFTSERLPTPLFQIQRR